MSHYRGPNVTTRSKASLAASAVLAALSPQKRPLTSSSNSNKAKGQAAKPTVTKVVPGVAAAARSNRKTHKSRNPKDSGAVLPSHDRDQRQTEAPSSLPPDPKVNPEQPPSSELPSHHAAANASCTPPAVDVQREAPPTFPTPRVQPQNLADLSHSASGLDDGPACPPLGTGSHAGRGHGHDRRSAVSSLPAAPTQPRTQYQHTDKDYTRVRRPLQCHPFA